MLTTLEDDWIDEGLLQGLLDKAEGSAQFREESEDCSVPCNFSRQLYSNVLGCVQSCDCLD